MVGDDEHLAQWRCSTAWRCSPGAVSSCDGSTDDHMRLPYALPPETLRSWVLRLSVAWRAYVERGVGDMSVTSAVT
jgi:hypothetical protein